MGKKESSRLFPKGHENDPAEERWPLSTLDYLTACTYNNYALFFKCADEDKPRVADVIRAGLEQTLAQCRHLVGSIEKNPSDGHHSFVKKKDDSVEFNIHWLDSPEDSFPSIADLEKAHFASSIIKDVEALSLPAMLYGEQPSCHPDANPKVAGYQLNFVPGGAILNCHSHHYSNDVMGWAGFVHQLADNCRAVFQNKTEAAPWDEACLDHSRWLPEEVPDESKVDGPIAPERNPLLKPNSSVLLHLPKSKMAELKKELSPTDGSWISSYDAFSALLWRVLCKHRAPLYEWDLNEKPLWGEGVNMRGRLNPNPPARIQRNIFFANLSSNKPDEAFTAGQIISEVPLSSLAAYVRKLTNETTDDFLGGVLKAVAPIRDKTSLFIRINSFPALTLVMTDWRDTRICEADFGFAKPTAFRHLFGQTQTEGLVIVYPPRSVDPASDEGNEFVVTFETELVDAVVKDPELSKYMEFRGFEVEKSTIPSAEKLP